MNISFMVVLGLSVLVDLALGAWAGVSFPHFARTWGLEGVVPSEVSHFLGWVLGTCLIGFAALQGVAFHWARRGRDEGPQLAIVFGCWLILSSLGTFAFASAHASSGFASMGWKFLLVDGLRGGLLLLMSVVALNAPSVVRELRLPDEARRRPRREERSERPRRERGPDRPRRREESRDGTRRRDDGHSLVRDSEARHRERRREGRGRDERRRDGRRRPARATALPDREEEAAVQERRVPSELPQRPLTVVVKGATERIRSLSAADDVPPPELDRIEPPAVGSTDPGDEGNRRRRRRRRRRPGRGEAELPFEEAAPVDDGLEDLVVVERDIEEPFGEDSGEGQEGASTARGRRRRRAPGRRAASEREAGTEERGDRPELHRASAVEAFDALRTLEPEGPRTPASHSVEDRAFGRSPRRVGRRPTGGARPPEDD